MGENVMPSTSVVKNPSGKILGSGQKIFAHNVYLKHKNEGMTKTVAIKLVATEVGISERSMFKIVAEMERSGILKSPKKTRERDDMYSKMSEDDKKAVRRCVHSFFKRKEMPTLDKIFQATKENVSIPPMSRSTLLKVLKKLGFVWEKRGRSRHLLPGRDQTEDLETNPCTPSLRRRSVCRAKGSQRERATADNNPHPQGK